MISPCSKKAHHATGWKLVAGAGFEPTIPPCGIMRTGFIFENARFIGIYENLVAYCDSILTRFLSAFVGNFYSGFVLIGFALYFSGCRQA
jgi:hypothetical protein